MGEPVLNSGLWLRLQGSIREASNGGVRTEYRGLLANILFENRYILSVESPDNDKSKVVAINEDYRVIAQVGEARKIFRFLIKLTIYCGILIR